jgi:glyoxylase-like metal-dependent hydrolase (beta-lactamase superfamily II)
LDSLAPVFGGKGWGEGVEDQEEVVGMGIYSIRAIALAEGPRDGSSYTYRENFGTRQNSACYIWYVMNSKPRTLIDAGARLSMFSQRGVPERELISLEAGLATLELKPEDIEIVIVTHLHWDHVALGSLYKNAKFIVQKKELDYARNPHPIDALHFEKGTFEDLDMEVIDGQEEIAPGISVFLTPGHSPGGQSVEIDTMAGKAIITGFCSTLQTFAQSDIMKSRGWQVSVPLIHQDVREIYNSVLQVKHRADIIIPLHDPLFIQKEIIP